MFHDPFHWFPSPIFSTLLAILFLGSFLIDYLAPRLNSPKAAKPPVVRSDRSSFFYIQVAGLIAMLLAFAIRYFGLAVAPGWLQWFGLLVGYFGLFFREWAVFRLGRYFSRVVEIEYDHKLITDGPYRRIRHPACTGMVLIDFGIALAIGSWLGAIIMLILVGSATLYRIHIEEALLLQAFGNEYRAYMDHTWRLFPGF